MLGTMFKNPQHPLFYILFLYITEKHRIDSPGSDTHSPICAQVVASLRQWESMMAI